MHLFISNKLYVSYLRFQYIYIYIYIHIYIYIYNNNFYATLILCNSDVSTCFTIFVKDQFLTKIHRLPTITLSHKHQKTFINQLHCNDIIDAYMIFFQGNL